ncbi:hypothetical protein Nepgr_003466 [Nepenthes gracilis]|uniref:NHL repeat-containing protein n=1 Tax=Nepenthes gracilis TaxID=150966 RepID=A0AAD3RZN0_NEPGR|nr:hypothetical protein Nepgr_003466 [Nepenthes gracilis]
MAPPFSHPAFVLVIFKLFLLHVLAKHVYEGGYTVTTVLDGNKLDINPYSVAPRAGVSHDLLLLDSSNSAFFTISLPISQDSVTKFSGSGVAGFSDGESDTATFNKPKSFAVDSKGNVYVADRNNLAIRKISNSGVTTIAGGNSDKPGRSDGSGQNASFSGDFDLTYIPDMCALLISDHGNKLVRQINLKPEDCRSSSRSAVGNAAIWGLGLGISCLVGAIIGFAVRPYIIPFGNSNLPNISDTWNRFLMKLGRLVPMLFLELKSGVASSTLLTVLRKLLLLIVSNLSLLFSFNRVRSVVVQTNHVSLLDSECLSSLGCEKPPALVDPLTDLMGFDGGSDTSNVIIKEENKARSENGSPDHSRRVDDLIRANMVNFIGDSSLDQASRSSNLVRRR